MGDGSLDPVIADEEVFFGKGLSEGVGGGTVAGGEAEPGIKVLETTGEGSSPAAGEELFGFEGVELDFDPAVVGGLDLGGEVGGTLAVGGEQKARASPSSSCSWRRSW